MVYGMAHDKAYSMAYSIAYTPWHGPWPTAWVNGLCYGKQHGPTVYSKGPGLHRGRMASSLALWLGSMTVWAFGKCPKSMGL